MFFMADLVHELIFKSADRFPDTGSAGVPEKRISYAVLAGRSTQPRKAMLTLGLDRGERVAVYLEKRLETVTRPVWRGGRRGRFRSCQPASET